MTAIVKTFRAPDARSALNAVKAALGAEAVILSTQQVGGGLFRAPEIEVTAALPPSAPAPTAATAPAAGTPAAAQMHGAARYQATARPASETNGQALTDELIALRSAVEGMRSQLRAQGSTADGGAGRFTGASLALFHHLVERGLESTLAEELIRLALSAHGGEPKALWAAVRSLLAERLVPSGPPWLPGPRRLIAFVGPTGVGKTTTLAKIAARALVESRLKLALITLDTYRIGAAEQVTRYGTMMSVPTRVAHTERDLARALDFSSNADLVLIDTAGRSRAEDISRQAAVLKTAPGVQLYLCLSAATGGRELAAAAARFAPLKPSRLVFTKLDEAAGPASVVSALGHTARPIACITNGQRVPEDIHALSSDQLLELVVGHPFSTSHT